MNNICILLSDANSISEDIIIKSFNKLSKSNLKKIYFIGDKDHFKKIFKKFKNNKFSFINIKIQNKNYFEYLTKITKVSLSLFKNKKVNYIINMPLKKTKFFKRNIPGFTEFFSKLVDKKNNENMLLYNENFSVSPLTTHCLIKDVDKLINKKKLINCIKNINQFFLKVIKKKIDIVVLGLNPHASIDFNKNSKDFNVLSPVIKKLKNKINLKGPVSADTAFGYLKDKVFIGMYHDQVLIPFKTLNKFNGINITIGKKIIRLSPDHGTAENLKGKIKLINNKSFLECIKFCEKY